jgi:hypothetical protein
MAARSSSHAIQAEQRYEARSSESFNRIAYAMALLKVLRPAMSVAVYPRNRHLMVERGPQRGQNPAWATFGVPPYATRQSIASALAELAGVSHEPFILDLLCAKAADQLD